VRDDSEEATLCIDTSISHVADLVRECTENTGVVSTVVVPSVDSFICSMVSERHVP
jgi:hypothetical protein